MTGCKNPARPADHALSRKANAFISQSTALRPLVLRIALTRAQDPPIAGVLL